MALEFTGTINPKRRIDFTSWTALVSRHAQLSLADSCEIINPFTNETETIEYPSEIAEVVVEADRQVRFAGIGTAKALTPSETWTP